jgi:hypothetical protein
MSEALHWPPRGLGLFSELSWPAMRCGELKILEALIFWRRYIENSASEIGKVKDCDQINASVRLG